jgi:hypothetical protein
MCLCEKAIKQFGGFSVMRTFLRRLIASEATQSLEGRLASSPPAYLIDLLPRRHEVLLVRAQRSALHGLASSCQGANRPPASFMGLLRSALHGLASSSQGRLLARTAEIRQQLACLNDKHYT